MGVQVARLYCTMQQMLNYVGSTTGATWEYIIWELHRKKVQPNLNGSTSKDLHVPIAKMKTAHNLDARFKNIPL